MFDLLQRNYFDSCRLFYLGAEEAYFGWVAVPAMPQTVCENDRFADRQHLSIIKICMIVRFRVSLEDTLMDKEIFSIPRDDCIYLPGDIGEYVPVFCCNFKYKNHLSLLFDSKCKKSWGNCTTFFEVLLVFWPLFRPGLLFLYGLI